MTTTTNKGNWTVTGYKVLRRSNRSLNYKSQYALNREFSRDGVIVSKYSFCSSR